MDEKRMMDGWMKNDRWDGWKMMMMDIEWWCMDGWMKDDDGWRVMMDTWKMMMEEWRRKNEIRGMSRMDGRGGGDNVGEMNAG